MLEFEKHRKHSNYNTYRYFFFNAIREKKEYISKKSWDLNFGPGVRMGPLTRRGRDICVGDKKGKAPVLLRDLFVEDSGRVSFPEIKGSRGAVDKILCISSLWTNNSVECSEC